MAMRYDSWIATSSEGRKVEFAYKELSDGVAAISAKTGELSIMVFERSVNVPLTRQQVEKFFERDDRPQHTELFDFDAERAKVGAMTIAELIEHCKVCAFAVKLRPASDAEWDNWYRLGIAREEWHRREWDKGHLADARCP
jgi:hypothetical protein